MDAGFILSPKALEEWTNVDSDEEWERLLEETGAEPTENYDVAKLKAAVKADRDILRSFAECAAQIKAETDPKLAELTVGPDQNPACRSKGRRRRRATRETSGRSSSSRTLPTRPTGLSGTFAEVVDSQKTFACYRGRIVSVAGQESRGGVSRENAVFGFVPESSDAPAGRDEDRFDILITTDVLAEGVNLQQCRNIINYDLPWNPMRLVQRHGRIDRIGSPHTMSICGVSSPTGNWTSC